MRTAVISIVIIVSLWGLFAFLVTPVRVVETSFEREFVINRKFSEVRTALCTNDLAREVVVSYGGEIVDKKAIEGSLKLNKPLQSTGTWDVHFVTLIVASTSDVKELVRIRQTINASPRSIEAVSQLENPLSNGVVDFQQCLELRSFGEKTVAKVMAKVCIKRKIPSFLYGFFQKEVSANMEERIYRFQMLVTEVSMRKTGFLLSGRKNFGML